VSAPAIRFAIAATDAARCTEERRNKMGPREKVIRENATLCYPPAGEEWLNRPESRAVLREYQLLDALEEALNGWEYAAGYKGEFLAKKHGDAEDIARLRQVLSGADQ
jgi:hypothetical protein